MNGVRGEYTDYYSASITCMVGTTIGFLPSCPMISLFQAQSTMLCAVSFPDMFKSYDMIYDSE